MLDLASAVEAQQQREQRSRELEQRDREHGGLTPYDRETEAKNRSAEGWGAYRCETSRADVIAARESIDPRRVDLKRLWIDCGLAVRRWAKKYRGDRAETLRDDALLLLLRWEQQGTAPSLDLGGTGGTPLRRDWTETVARADGRSEQKLTSAAWRALHAAVKQSAQSPSFLQLDPEQEISTDPLDIASAVEEQQQQAGNVSRYPDTTAVDIIARAMDVSLDSARAIVAADKREGLAEQWSVSEQAARNAISRGKRALREQFPSIADLLSALDGAAAGWRAEHESSAILSLIDYRDGRISEGQAIAAVSDWQGTVSAMPSEQRALLAAARRVSQRNGHTYGGERAERVALVTADMMTAARARARETAASAARGSHLQMTRTRLDPQSVQHRERIAPTTALPSSAYGRARLYARTAADEKTQHAL